MRTRAGSEHTGHPYPGSTKTQLPGRQAPAGRDRPRGNPRPQPVYRFINVATRSGLRVRRLILCRPVVVVGDAAEDLLALDRRFQRHGDRCVLIRRPLLLGLMRAMAVVVRHVSAQHRSPRSISRFLACRAVRTPGHKRMCTRRVATSTTNSSCKGLRKTVPVVRGIPGVRHLPEARAAHCGRAAAPACPGLLRARRRGKHGYFFPFALRVVNGSTSRE